METQEVHYIVCFSKDKSYVTSKLTLLLKLRKKIQKHHFPQHQLWTTIQLQGKGLTKVGWF